MQYLFPFFQGVLVLAQVQFELLYERLPASSHPVFQVGVVLVFPVEWGDLAIVEGVRYTQPFPLFNAELTRPSSRVDVVFDLDGACTILDAFPLYIDLILLLISLRPLLNLRYSFCISIISSFN